MKRKLIALVVANLLAGAAYSAENGGLKWSGEAGLGLRYVKDKASDPSKLREFRDLDTDPITMLDVRAESERHRFNIFGENIGQDDQYLSVMGTQFGVYRFRLYSNEVRHRFGSGPGALSPYSGIGTNTLTATLPNPDVSTWNPFDNSMKRRDMGGMVEWSAHSPWYVRFDGNEVSRKGIKVIGGAKGTSPGNGNMDLPSPVDWKTFNVALEGGYQATNQHLAVSWHHSKFKNDNEVLRWSNDFFAPGAPTNRDTSTLPADNELWRLGINGNIRGLPWGSILAGRVTYSKLTNDVSVLPTMLAPLGTNPSTAANVPVYHGEIVNTTAAFSLNSRPTTDLDTRLYYNYRQKDNNSTQMVFTPTAASTLQCSGGPCRPELFSYTKHNIGLEGFYRVNRENRLGMGYDFYHTKRERIDFPKSKEQKYFAEWKNNALDWLDTRARYQYMQRRSTFAFHVPADPIDGFVRRFDLANLDQHQLKLRFDMSPAPLVNLGLDMIFKNNDYKDTILGRTKDVRQEYNVSAGYGDPNGFRVHAFADYEIVKLDSFHRVGTGNPDPASGFIAVPLTHNWTADNADKSWQVGLGLTWKQLERLTWHTNLLYAETRGQADFTAQAPTAVVTGGLLPAHFDNTNRIAFNLKGVYQYDKQWQFTGGYAFERYRYSDIGYDNFQYTIAGATPTQRSYFTGEGAFQPYTAHIFYVIATLKF